MSDSIKEKASSIFSAEVTVKIAIRVEDDIVDAVNEIASEMDIGLVIKSNMKEGGGIHNPMDWRLIREISLPLLLVSNRKRKVHPVVLATIDIDESSDYQKSQNGKVLDWTKYCAGLLNCDIQAIYNIPMSKATLELEVFQPDEILNREGPEKQKALIDILESNEVKATKALVTAGDISKNIPRATSKEKPEILVVGTKGRKGIKGFLLGNTVEKILKNTQTDVLVIRSAG